MSMGPSRKEEKFQISLFSQARNFVSKSAELYFADPLPKLFYGSLASLLIGLFFGMEFNLKFYVLVGLLALVECYKYYLKNKK